MKKRILIVEDNPIEASELRCSVRGTGFDVEVAGDAERGFARLQSEHFDVLLCDLHLPGENGFMLCRRVKQSDALRDTPVVLLTRSADPLNFLRGLEAGADGFISKGQQATNICERLTRVLSRQEALARDPEHDTNRVVFLQNEFEIASPRSQLLEVLLSGFEDVVLLNSKYEAETTARLEAQKSLRDAHALYLSLVETIAVGVVRKDVDGKYVFANKMACEIFGKGADEFTGKTDFDLYPPQVAEHHATIDRFVLETGETQEECIEHDLGSGKRYFNLRRSSVRNFGGDIVGTQTMWSDVTAFKCAATELIQAKELAEEASLAKSQFLSSMSHELRTPLNGVIGMAELLAGTALSERQRQFVDACRSSGEALLGIINDILDFSKIEAGKMELDLHDFGLEKLVTDTVDTMSWRAADKALEMPCYVEQNSRLVLNGDSNRLRQVLVNLVGNAIKFTAAGEIVVRTKTIHRRDDRMTIRFSVSDTGIGISSDKRDRLFKSFSQVDASTTRHYGGTGLGLAISQNLVHLMGGTMGVDSEAGQGSTFWFEVPFVVASDGGEGACDALQLAGRRTLIVDDHETSRLILAAYATGCGLTAVTTNSMDEALAAFDLAATNGAPFDLVLADYNMPNGNGLELARALPNGPRQIVLLLGSTDIHLEADELPEHGVHATLRKPVRRHELYDVLCGLLADVRPTELAAGDEPCVAMARSLPTGHVLLAEDNGINRMYMVELLKQIGCSCDTAATGREAFAAVQRRDYDLVLMDCQMPEMDGFEATRRIRQWEADTVREGRLPIVALTANAVQGDRQQCLDAGMDDYLSKPVQREHIIGVLERFFHDAPQSSLTTEAPIDSNDRGDELVEAMPIDAESLLARCFGNLEFAGSLLDELESTGVERVEEIRRHAARCNPVAAADAAHALKGAAGILCAASVQELATQIERAGRASNVSEMEAQLSELVAEMKRCLNYVPRLRQDLKFVKEGA